MSKSTKAAIAKTHVPQVDQTIVFTLKQMFATIQSLKATDSSTYTLFLAPEPPIDCQTLCSIIPEWDFINQYYTHSTNDAEASSRPAPPHLVQAPQTTHDSTSSFCTHDNQISPPSRR